ncbi:MAG: DMT family transporter [Pseudomonadota bacterium]|nr:DMT family transporter [Pseudomonadota bacterium]MBU1397565.1 DMT family transporter [Pseudomonadota bacterium]MBU1571321.1 DMT family transporter [Pseudomonadota bacterium]
MQIKTELSVNHYIALGVGVAAVSTGAIFARLAEAPAIVIAAYRVGLASLIIAPVAWIWAKDEIINLSRREIVLSALSGLFLALHFAAWISSLSYTSIANSVVLVNTNPLWVGLLTPFITGERLKTASVVGIIISVIGAAIIGASDYAAGENALFGDFLALIGGICAAFYLLIGRNLRRKLSLAAYIMVCYGSAAVFLWIAVLSLGMQITGYSTSTVASFFGLAIVSQLIGHTCFNWALRWFTPGLVAVTLLGEPIGSTILAYVIFNEKLTLMKLAGGGLILAAIYISASAENSKTDQV